MADAHEHHRDVILLQETRLSEGAQVQFRGYNDYHLPAIEFKNPRMLNLSKVHHTQQKN